MEIRKAILATVSYYDAFEYSLTLFEIHRYLISPQRFTRQPGSLGEVTIEMVSSGINNLVEKETLVQKFGLYSLNGREQIILLRIEREKISSQKWRTFLRRAWWLQLCPWIEGFFASGS